MDVERVSALKRGTRDAYTAFSAGYMQYADDVVSITRDGLFEFLADPRRENDRTTWRFLTDHLRMAATELGHPPRVIDVGCGPGVWLGRMLLEFPEIEGVGVDVTEPFIAQAREVALAVGVGDRCRLEVGDGTNLDQADKSFDVAVCLHDVLNNEPDYVGILRNLHRVARHSVVVSVHAVHAPATCHVTSNREVRAAIQDDGNLRIDWDNGSSLTMYSRLFSATEITELIGRFGKVASVRGVDLLGTRFSTTSGVATPFPLVALEEHYREDPTLIDYYKHILVVSRLSAP